jgi:hypothetical protein
MRSILLFKVDHCFEITQKGLLISGNLVDKETMVLTHDTIKLIKPNGETLTTQVKGIDFRGNLLILLSSEFSKHNIPIGTEVWKLY